MCDPVEVTSPLTKGESDESNYRRVVQSSEKNKEITREPNNNSI